MKNPKHLDYNLPVVKLNCKIPLLVFIKTSLIIEGRSRLGIINDLHVDLKANI